jgi:hypothetical protein
LTLANTLWHIAANLPEGWQYIFAIYIKDLKFKNIKPRSNNFKNYERLITNSIHPHHIGTVCKAYLVS